MCSTWAAASFSGIDRNTARRSKATPAATHSSNGSLRRSSCRASSSVTIRDQRASAGSSGCATGVPARPGAHPFTDPSGSEPADRAWMAWPNSTFAVRIASRSPLGSTSLNRAPQLWASCSGMPCARASRTSPDTRSSTDSSTGSPPRIPDPAPAAGRCAPLLMNPAMPRPVPIAVCARAAARTESRAGADTDVP